MPNASYQKGYRFEKRVQAWLAHIGLCERSVGSRGKDLWLTRLFRRWSVSCKCRKKNNPVTMKTLKKELEEHDAFAWGEDREIPLIAMHLPKFVELVGQAEAQDFTDLSAA